MMSFGVVSRATAVAAALLGISVLSSTEGCGPGDTRYYCDNAGCYNCDGYGCRPVTPPSPQACTGDTSCPQGQVCTVTGCETVCQADADCPQGTVCKQNLCVAPTGNPPDKQQCTTKSDCGASEECVNNTCQACGGTNGPCSCTQASDCGSNQVCSGGLCEDKTNVCQYSSECGQGRVCADGQCLTDCSQGQTCPNGASCQKGVCEPVSGNQCQSNADCSGGTPKCVDGSCVPACTADADCGGNGLYCDQGACVVDNRPKPNCTTQAECSSNQQCLGGYCRYTCSGDQECKLIDARIGYCAKDGTCRDAQEANADCLQSSDCTQGQVCISNQCK